MKLSARQKFPQPAGDDRLERLTGLVLGFRLFLALVYFDLLLRTTALAAALKAIFVEMGRA